MPPCGSCERILGLERWLWFFYVVCSVLNTTLASACVIRTPMQWFCRLVTRPVPVTSCCSLIKSPPCFGDEQWREKNTRWVFFLFLFGEKAVQGVKVLIKHIWFLWLYDKRILLYFSDLCLGEVFLLHMTHTGARAHTQHLFTSLVQICAFKKLKMLAWNVHPRLRFQPLAAAEVFKCLFCDFGCTIWARASVKKLPQGQRWRKVVRGHTHTHTKKHLVHVHKVVEEPWCARSRRRSTEPFSSASLEPGFKCCRLQLVCRFHGIREPGRLLAHTPASPLAFRCDYRIQNNKVCVQFERFRLAIIQRVNSLFVTS